MPHFCQHVQCWDKEHYFESNANCLKHMKRDHSAYCFEKCPICSQSKFDLSPNVEKLELQNKENKLQDKLQDEIKIPQLQKTLGPDISDSEFYQELKKRARKNGKWFPFSVRTGNGKIIEFSPKITSDLRSKKLAKKIINFQRKIFL